MKERHCRLRSMLMRETAGALYSGRRKWKLFWLFSGKSTIHTHVRRPRKVVIVPWTRNIHRQSQRPLWPSR